MPRTREFNPEQALTEAMQVFWSKGFADTSIDDLVQATGVSRYGLYGEFGNKRGLFRAAIRHYNEHIIGRFFGLVEADDASLASIRAYFAQLVEASQTPLGKKGCLMCNTLTEEAAWDGPCVDQLKAFQLRIRGGFARALRRAQAQGELEADVEPAEMAHYLLGIAIAVSTMSRQPVDQDAVALFVESALARLAWEAA